MFLWNLDLLMKESVCLDCCCPYNSSCFKSLINPPLTYNEWHLQCVWICSVSAFCNCQYSRFRSLLLFFLPVLQGYCQVRLTCIWMYRLTQRFEPGAIGHCSRCCGRGLRFIFTINELSMAAPPWPILNRFSFGRGQACDLANFKCRATRPRWPDDKAWYHV